MALNVTTKSTLHINDTGVQKESLNAAFSKLIANDKSMLVSNGISPIAWERKWINDSSVKGYSKGTAVWINTEDENQFVQNHLQDISAYVITNSETKQQLQHLVDNQQHYEANQLLKKAALYGLSESFKSIYYLNDNHDLTNRAQIRVSLVDNNKEEPTASAENWKNFFYEIDKNAINLSVSTLLKQLISDSISNHESSYHLKGQLTDKSELSSKYLLNDMSNITDKQSFNSHYWHVARQTGFDHVKYFAVKTYATSSKLHLNKWFRLWDSGLLEHGGIVLYSDPSCTGDTKTGEMFKVNLKWMYDSDKLESIVYDYPTNSFNDFYSDMKTVDGQNVLDHRLTDSKHYSVVVTRQIRNSNVIPYSQKTDDRYDNVNICFLNNQDFTFIPTDSANGTYYSYYVRGYTSKTI